MRRRCMGEESLWLFRSILRGGGLIPSDEHIVPSVLRSCPCLSNLSMIHATLLKSGLDSDPHIRSALIRTYSSHDLQDALRAFACCPKSQTFSWNAMIHGSFLHGEASLARSLFVHMDLRDVASWNTMITGFFSLGLLSAALRIFSAMPHRNAASWNSLLAGQSRCGDVDGARRTFDAMPGRPRGILSWNAMLTCYAQNGRPSHALRLFDEMLAEGLRPTPSTLVSLAFACSQLGSPGPAERAVRALGAEPDPVLATALVHMYSRCGRLGEAERIFKSIRHKDSLAWNAIIGGMASHGRAAEALSLFDEMAGEGRARPDDATFVAVLSACSRAGMVGEGRRVLARMEEDHGVAPKAEHYNCAVDMMARAGLLEEAERLAREMPVPPNAQAWGALLGGCRIHGDSSALAERAGKELIALQPSHSGRYILLSNVYAAANRWEESRGVRSAMAGRGVWKEQGASEVELGGVVSRFVAGDRTHLQAKQIYGMLRQIQERLRAEMGYEPDTSQALVDMEEEDKEQMLSAHSEKLAIAFGLLRTSPGDCIRILKNLRVCRDCHTVSKLVSGLYHREIVMRDRSRFHVFRDGVCSCRDFW